MHVHCAEENHNLARLDDQLERSSTVMVGDNKNNKLGRIKGGWDETRYHAKACLIKNPVFQIYF